MKEKKEVKNNNIKKIIILIGIIIIPLMYSYFYLDAFWDPYSKLEKLPIAVVNQDQGAVINDVNRNIGNELKENMSSSNELNFCFVSKEEADTGLNGNKYYAIIVIPENFSKQVSTASSTDKSVANLIYSPNEKTNYLATQILNRAILQLSDEVKANVVGEVVDNLANNLNQVPDKLNEINSGVEQLYNGSQEINQGTGSLSSGISTLSNSYKTFNSSISSAKSGASELNVGSQKLNDGLSQVLTGTKELDNSTKDLYKINDSIKLLNQGTNTLNSSTNEYVNGVNSYIAQSNEIGKKIQAYIASNPTALADPNMQYIVGVLTNPTTTAQVNALSAGGSKLTAGVSSLNTNLGTLANSTTDLYKINEGITSVSTGVDSLSTGANTLHTGIQSLETGLTKLETASNKIDNAIGSASVGASQLNQGTSSLEDGLKQANTKITEGSNSTKDELQKLNGISEYSKEPVKVEQQTVESVPNYGTAFAPYFISLSLWVGGLIIFVAIYFDPNSRFNILSQNSNNVYLRAIIFFTIGIIQAILLAVVIQFALNMTIQNVLMYYISCILVSIAFVSIIQFFMVHFKDFGKFMAIVLLILQLTSCGGTFPMELVPGFFNKIYSFMPMTYSVQLFKETITGGNMHIIFKNMSVLILVSIAFIVLTSLVTILKEKRAKRKAETLVEA